MERTLAVEEWLALPVGSWVAESTAAVVDQAVTAAVVEVCSVLREACLEAESTASLESRAVVQDCLAWPAVWQAPFCKEGNQTSTATTARVMVKDTSSSRLRVLALDIISSQAAKLEPLNRTARSLHITSHQVSNSLTDSPLSHTINMDHRAPVLSATLAEIPVALEILELLDTVCRSLANTATIPGSIRRRLQTSSRPARINMRLPRPGNTRKMDRTNTTNLRREASLLLRVINREGLARLAMEDLSSLNTANRPINSETKGRLLPDNTVDQEAHSRRNMDPRTRATTLPQARLACHREATILRLLTINLQEDSQISRLLGRILKAVPLPQLIPPQTSNTHLLPRAMADTNGFMMHA